MAEYLAKQIRNVALAGHAGSGKTSLAEALLFKAGATDRQGRVEDGNTAMDFDPDEIKRQTTISSKIFPLEWKGKKINLLDTPGLFDFAGGLTEGIFASDSVIICVSAKSGVSVGTKKAFKAAKELGKSKAFFISKMDADHVDFDKVLGGLTAAFGSAVCPLVIPHMKGDKVECYVSVLDNKAYTYNEKGAATEVSLPGISEDIEAYMDIISEAVAETSDEAMEKFFSGEPFTKEEIADGIHEGVKAGTLIPVFCGSGTNMHAIDIVLDSIADHLPSPRNKFTLAGEDKKGEKITAKCDEEAPFSGIVFKTIADPFVGKLSFIKVITGKLSADTSFINARTEEPDRMGKIIFIKGKKQEEAAAIHAGDIGAITKLSDTKTGDTLCDASNLVRYGYTAFQKPTLTMAIKVLKKGEEGKVAQGLNRLMEEDPTITFYNNSETRQQLLSGLGEQHLDVIITKLKAKFGVDIELIKPRFAYRETIRKKVKVEGKHKKQSGGHGQYGHVWIEFEPHDGQELIFATNVFGGSVPKNYFPAVEKGLQDSIETGVIAGYPVVGLKATLYDGSYHAVDSSEMAFKLAASLAYKAGVAQAGPVLLEPIGKLKVTVPDSATGDIMGELNKKRGRVFGMNPAGDGETEIEAEAPMSEMHDFTTILRSITQGQGTFTFEFERYEQLPAANEAAVIAEAKKMAEEE